MDLFPTTNSSHAANGSSSSIPPKLSRTKALAEASAVETVTASALDTFHLLGVVADPRYYEATSSSNAKDTYSYGVSLWEDAVRAVGMGEPTAMQVMDESSAVLDQQTLQEEFPPVDTTTVEQYLESTGESAASFRAIVADHAAANNGSTSQTSLNNKKNSNEQAEGDLLISTTSAPDNPENTSTEVDSIFFDDKFDLTHPDTFAKLLLLGGTDATLQQQPSSSTPVADWFPLVAEETWQSQWDTIEAALLERVRANATQFFDQSQRFASLQSSITELLDLVQTTLHDKLEASEPGLEPLVIVPQADTERQALQQLYALCVQCSQVLEGTTSNNDDDVDDLQALEHIRAVRAQLQAVHRVQALQPVAERWSQYHTIVEHRIRDALVDRLVAPTLDATTATMVRAVISSASWHDAYTQRLQQTIRMTVRTTVAEFSSGTNANSTYTISKWTMANFLSCWDMIVVEQDVMASVVQVQAWLLTLQQPNNTTTTTSIAEDSTTTSEHQQQYDIAAVVAAAAEAVGKAMGELLRLRKEAHALATLDDLKAMGTRVTQLADRLDQLVVNGSTSTTVLLRSTLMAQAKAFLERRHEANMARLAGALDAERWVACDVSAHRQDSLTRLCTGRTLGDVLVVSTNSTTGSSPQVQIDGTGYRVVWSCLLVMEMVLSNVAAAAQFPTLAASSCVSKVAELLRLFNTRATQLVLGAGAIHSHAKLRSINAKHLSLVTQSLGAVTAALPYVKGALVRYLPKKMQQKPLLLLTSLDQIGKEYADHNEKVLNKLVSIIGGLVERELSKRIPGIDFDARAQATPSAEGAVVCCAFLEEITSHTRRMHQVIKSLLRPDHLQDTFSKIFAFLDTKVPALLVSAANRKQVFQKQDPNSPKQHQQRRASATNNAPSFSFPKTDDGKRQLLLEVETMTHNLNCLEGVRPWDFTATHALEKTLNYSLNPSNNNEAAVAAVPTTEEGTATAQGNGTAAGEDQDDKNNNDRAVEENMEDDLDEDASSPPSKLTEPDNLPSAKMNQPPEELAPEAGG